MFLPACLFPQTKKMKELKIHNFRCYETKSIVFRPGINLLVGDNSSGKTSLIRACNFVANSFFCGYSDENTNWKSVDENDFKLNIGDENTILPEKPVSIDFRLSESDFPPIDCPDGNSLVFDYEGTSLKLEKKSKKNSRNLVAGLTALKELAASLYSYSHIESNGKLTQYNTLPVYACFTTEDIHAYRKIDATKFKAYAQKPSFGYFECYDCRGLFDYWLKRLLVLQEAEIGETEILSVRNALRDALGKDGCNIVDDIIIRPMRGKVLFKLTDGRLVSSELLSDGYKRLINIVLDIAIRCSLLNKVKYGAECYKHTHGTVIIDEIDEHLHPALQIRILKDLQRTFPKIQFIVSSHAPLVISSVEKKEENVVYRLWYDRENRQYYHKELDTYGLDANLILEEQMMVESRDIAIKEMMNHIESLVHERQLEKAKAAMRDLESKTAADQPALIRIRSVINRLESRK